MNPLNSLRFTFHQKNWGKCLLFNLANDCLLNWANSQKWQLSSLKLLFWVKIGVILWICSALQAVLSFSAWEKSRDSTHRIFILEHKMRSWEVILHDCCNACRISEQNLDKCKQKDFLKIIYLYVFEKKIDKKKHCLFILCNNIVVAFKFFDVNFWLYVSRY